MPIGFKEPQWKGPFRIEAAKTSLNVKQAIRKNRIARLGIDLAKTVFHVCGAGGGAGGCGRCR